MNTQIMTRSVAQKAWIFATVLAGCNGSEGELATHENATSPRLQQTLYHGGEILTMAGDQPQYVEVLVERDGKIVFVGSKADALERFAGKADEVDLAGKALLPGLIDAHSHYVNALSVARQVKLYAPPAGPGKDVDSIIAEIKRFAAENGIGTGEMIMGYGYDDTVMPNGRLLNRDDLDSAFPDNPVRIDHVSMHGAVMNSLALEQFGIDESFETPPGGVIVRKPGTNEPYGLIMETAFLPVFEKSPPLTLEEEIDGTRAAHRMYAEAGITTANEGATHLQQLQTIKRATGAGANSIDVIAYPFITDLEKILAEFPVTTWGEYRNHFKIGGVKITSDGSPQGRTAFFTTPYLTGGPGGEEDWRGEPTFPAEVLQQALASVYDLGVPLIYHANGDAAIDMLLEAHEIVAANDPGKDRNVTIIHAQFLRKDQIPKLVEYKMRPSFYTLHTYYFAEAHIENRGREQAMYISPMRDAIDAGLHPTNHTDAVVAPLDQMFMLWSAVNRVSRGGETIGQDQRVTPYEGLKAMTAWVAEQYGEEDTKGTLEPGKYADLVILSDNPLTVDPMDIRDIKVLETIKQGESVFRSD